MFTILQHNYFCMFIFLFPLYVNWNGWLNYNKVLFHCNFPFPDVVIATDATPTHWAFYLQGFGLPGQVPCVGLILPCRNFRLLPSCYIGWPSVSLVRWFPCIWITVLLRHTCVIKVVQCLLFFPDWPARY